MRTTLDIDEDLLQLAKHTARQSGISMGRVVSDMARKSLEIKDSPATRNGVPLFTPTRDASPANLALVNRLRDEE